MNPLNYRLGQYGGFFWKLYGTYVGVVVVSSAFVAVLVFQFFVGNARSNMERQIGEVAGLLASLGSSNPQELWTPIAQNRVNELASRSESDIDIVLANGRVVASSRQLEAKGGEELLAWPEFASAIRTGFGEEARREESENFDTLHVVRAIMIRSDHIGYVRVSRYMGALVPEYKRLATQIALGTLLAAGFSILGGVFFGRTVTKPLREIEQGCVRILEGDLTVPIAMRRKDEFGLVAESVDRMAESLTQQLRQIERQKNRLELVLRLLHDGVIALDGQGRLVFMNAAAESFCRCGQAESCIGEYFEEAIAVEGICSLIVKHMSGEREQEQAVYWSIEGQEKRYLSVYISHFDTETHDMEGMLVVIRDITERRRFEALRRDFASNVSHELKTPITAIATLIEALQSGAASEPELRQNFLGRIQTQNQRLKRLVDELLAISKLESGKGALKLERCDLRGVVGLVKETFQTMARLRDIDFSVNCPESPVMINGDQTSLELAVNSLVDNAFKYTSAGGQISVEIHVSKRSACIEVTDTGCGIPKEHQDRVFERFYRIEASRSRGLGGSGLGLAIVKHMAIAHGGEVQLQSEEDKGSRFELILPLA